MIKEKTVFVLGAGSNIPYGFPSAKELREKIIDKTFYDILYEFLPRDTEYDIEQSDRTLGQITTFQEIFSKSSIKSVDYFLMRNPSYLDLGKSK
ncbi:MAG TPA: hypothetical protein ENN33_07940 [Ignavibacteria bacterium]|nr:hypothetical protein [Ignavibacteria bacterium]